MSVTQKPHRAQRMETPDMYPVCSPQVSGNKKLWTLFILSRLV